MSLYKNLLKTIETVLQCDNIWHKPASDIDQTNYLKYSVSEAKIAPSPDRSLSSTALLQHCPKQSQGTHLLRWPSSASNLLTINPKKTFVWTLIRIYNLYVNPFIDSKIKTIPHFDVTNRICQFVLWVFVYRFYEKNTRKIAAQLIYKIKYWYIMYPI